MSKHCAFIFGLGTAVVVSALSGCGSSSGIAVMDQNGQEVQITNAAEILSQAEQEWIEYLDASRERYAVAQESQCFFVRDDAESQTVQWGSWCGPVSLLDGPQNTWTFVPMTLSAPSASEEGELVINEDITPVWAGEASSPVFDLLLDAQGNQPDEQVSTPDPTPAEAQSRLLYPLGQGDEVQPQWRNVEGDEIIYPGDGLYALDRVGTVSEVQERNSTEWVSSRRVAPQGQVLRAFDLEVSLPRISLLPEDVTTFLTVGDQRIDVTDPLQLDQFAVLLPSQDTEVTLHVISDDVEQTLDLNTGVRTSAVASDFYAPAPSQTLNTTFSQAVSTPGGPARYEGAVVGVSRAPYMEDLGWADQGNSSWLQISFQTPTWVDDSSTYAVINPRGNFSLVSSSGQTYSPEEITGGQIEGTGTLVFKVPPGENEYTLRSSPTGNFTNFAGAETPVAAETFDVPISMQ